MAPENTITPRSPTALRAVELFAGIGGFRQACDRVGIQTVFANDFAPKAAKVYASNYKNILLGDINDCLDLVPAHDLLTAGIPCQPFSSAGKKLGIQDPRGTLFQTVVDLLVKHQPQFFVIENVKRLLTMEGGAHFSTILNALSRINYFLEWRLINAADFGLAQNRQRIVITGRREEPGSKPSARLAGKLELEQACSFSTITAQDQQSWSDLGGHEHNFENWGIARHGKFYSADVPFLFPAAKATLEGILESEVSEEFDFTTSTLDRISSSTLVDAMVQGVHILYNQAGGARMGYTVFGTRGLAPTVTSSASRHYERYKVGEKFRRLTNVEYARLQGFPDHHCDCVSVHDQYFLYGNAFPPPMAEWVLRHLMAPQNDVFESIEERGQLEFAIF